METFLLRDLALQIPIALTLIAAAVVVGRREWPPSASQGFLLALVAACLARRRREELWGFGAALGLGVVTWLVVGPDVVPARWITVLQEGSVASVVASLHGQGHHGPGFDALRWLLGSGDGLAIRDVVQMNLALAAMNTVIVGALTWSLSGRPALGLLTAAAWALALCDFTSRKALRCLSASRMGS